MEKPSESANVINSIITELNLIDIWRFMKPESRRFTRREMCRGGLLQTRLDYWLISNHMLYNFFTQDIVPGLKSDHSLVYVQLSIENTQKRGRGFFKFNCSLLKDTEYVKHVKDMIDTFKSENKHMTNLGLKWDVLKCEIRGYTVSYATAVKKKKMAYELELKKWIEILEKNLNDNNYLEYKTIQNQIEQAQKEYTMGAQVRSKAKAIEETEQNIAYFRMEEKKNYNVRYIRSLYKEDDTIITELREILKEEEIFYKTLYTKPDHQTIDKSLFQHTDIPKLSVDDLEICDAPISEIEIGKALKNLPNNKTPGTDGFTSEFYKFFWIDIKDLVYYSLLYAFDNGSLSIEQRQGILALIPKKDKDFRRLKNWRPLTLLNTDYKILTKLLAHRLQKVISKLVKKDQTGYIKGRYIGENIRNLYDIINISTLYNLPDMIVTLDFEKAFDSVSWDFLLQTLQAFGFGPIFCSWIQTLYSDPQIRVMNNGHNSEFFTISRGIRQGCPISALLFILVVEIMAIHLRNNPAIKGIKYNDKNEIILSQLADDTTLYLTDINSLKHSIDFIKHFGKSCGLKLNTDKSEAFWIGKDSERNDKPLGL